jgi:nitrate/nitrite-specific signal transduction histidine kinase
MRNSVDIDTSHSRAIIREIGERLRASFEEERELPASFRTQIERLRQLEDERLKS